MSVMDPAAFVRDRTVLARPPLVPELRLHLATAVTPLWEATEQTLARTGTPPPFWAFAWAGGQALARHLIDRPGLVAGRRVLDFGSGSGLVALAAALAGAARVEAADIDPFAAAAIAINAGCNGLQVSVRTEDLIGRDDGWDAVLAGDLCYERPLAERLMPWLHALAARGACVLLADPGRAYLPATGLVEVDRHAVPVDLELEDRAVRETVVYRLEAGSDSCSSTMR